jgi:signal transduction histidine kinase
MIFGKLGIRGKLNLLLLLPLVAVLLVATPFLINQISSARSAGHTSEVAGNARSLGSLTWELQRERLLTAAFLALPSSGDGNLRGQQRTVDDAVRSVRSSLGADAPDELAAALVRIGSLQELRTNALGRGASLDSVARTYHAVISAVIDAVRLVPQKTSDAEGTRQLTALEALLRANEESSLRGMALIVAAVSPQTGVELLADASNQAQQFTERFVQQADVAHAALVVQVEQGEEAKRVTGLAGDLPATTRDIQPFVTDALSNVEAQASLRRTVQDRVISQISDAAAGRASDASDLAWAIGGGAAVLFLLVAILAVAVSRSIANPLRQLTTAATEVADLADAELVRVTDTEESEDQVPRLAAIDLASNDELGKLAAAFNRVQSTAASLVERQAVTRRNVSLMFANVAQRTQNLVGRQLALVDELERNEQDERLLASLYKLDHLSTRLRRNADNLLVVAGTQDDTKIAAPSELAVTLRSALAEIEDYQRVRLGSLAEIVLSSSLGTDLIQVFAELLENATAFSPPDSFVEVETSFLNDGACLVSVVDHGIGMTEERLAEENRRLVERERLDIAPTSMLGLFVVGRLARRHGLYVDLVATPGGGVTARVVIPAAAFTRLGGPEPVAEPSIESPAWQPLPVLSAGFAGGFTWFAPEVAASKPAAPVGLGRDGLRRRVAGAQLPGATEPSPTADRRTHDPAAVRSAMDGFQSGIVRATAEQPVISALIKGADEPNRRSGLRRRVAGAQLPGAVPGGQPAERTKQDPEATRTAMDGFQTAFARAAREPAADSASATLRTPISSLPPGPASPLRPTSAARPDAASRAPRSSSSTTSSRLSGQISPPGSTTPAAPAAPVGRPAGRGISDTPPRRLGAPEDRRAGLSRRVPGENLAPGLRRQVSELRQRPPGSLPPRATGGWHERNPEAERSAFDGYSSGLTRANDGDPTKESRG